MRLRKKLFFIILAVLLVLTSCQRVPKEVVKANNEELTSFSYNGVEYVEHVYDSDDSFRPFQCSYSLTESKRSILEKDLYSIDESFVADKRDKNLNFIYMPTLLWETSIYQRKSFIVPELKDIHNEVDNILIVYPDINTKDNVKKQVIDDPRQISLILNFFESLDSSKPIKSDGLPADNKEIYMCAVSGYYGGEFDVGPEFIYFSDGELIAFVDGKQYKAPAEVNDILQNTKRIEYQKELTFMG